MLVTSCELKRTQVPLRHTCMLLSVRTWKTSIGQASVSISQLLVTLWLCFSCFQRWSSGFCWDSALLPQVIGPAALFPILSWVLVLILVCIACVSVHACGGWGRPLVCIHRVFSCISQAAGWLVSSTKLPESAFPSPGITETGCWAWLFMRCWLLML